jgi:hypothetical protein
LAESRKREVESGDEEQAPGQFNAESRRVELKAGGSKLVFMSIRPQVFIY